MSRVPYDWESVEIVRSSTQQELWEALPHMMALDPEFCRAVLHKALPSVVENNALLKHLQKKQA